MISLQNNSYRLNIILLFTRLFIVFSLLTAAFQIHADEIAVQYNSRYVSEGRNNLAKGGIVWLNGSFDLAEKIVAGLTYGHSTSNDQNFDELNITLVYADRIEEIDWYVGLNRLEFFKDNAHDNEISVGISYSGLEVVRIFSDAYYSTQANGYFVEVGVDRLFNLAENIDLTPYAKAGFDFGYASEIYNGHNHIAVGVQLDYGYSEDLSLFILVEYLDAGGDITRDLDHTKNEFWIGFGLVSSF